MKNQNILIARIKPFSKLVKSSTGSWAVFIRTLLLPALLGITFSGFSSDGKTETPTEPLPRMPKNQALKTERVGGTVLLPKILTLMEILTL